MSGTDAYRLKLLFPLTEAMVAAQQLQQLQVDDASPSDALAGPEGIVDVQVGASL